MMVLGKLQRTYSCRILLEGSNAVYKICTVDAYTAQQAALAAIQRVPGDVRPQVFGATVLFPTEAGNSVSLWRYDDAEGRVWQP